MSARLAAPIVVFSSWEKPMFHSILVAIDGSDHSDAAIHYACDLAEKYDATLHFLHVPEVESSAIAVGSGAVLIPPSDERISEAGEPIMTQAVTLAKVQNRAPETTTIAQGNPDYCRSEMSGSDCAVDRPCLEVGLASTRRDKLPSAMSFSTVRFRLASISIC